MNGIAILLWTLAASGQISSGAMPAGVRAGWKPESDGSMSYIAQVTPEIANQMATQGQEMALDIPVFLQGRVNRVVWRIGNSEVEREPSEAELRANPPRQVFPKSGETPLGPSGLTSLSDQVTGNTVMIDSPRPNAAALPTLGVARESEADPSLPAVPSLAQYTSPPARSVMPSQFDVPRSSPIGVNGSAAGIAPVLPKQDLLPSPTKSFIGPQLPPGSNYTGGQVTVTGAPSSASNTSGWSDNRSVGSSTSYGAGNPLESGNFGNANNYGAMGQAGNFAVPANQGFSSSPSQGFSPSPNSTGFGYSNVNARPDAYVAANNPGYGSAPYGANSAAQPSTQAQSVSANQSWNNAYAPGSNYPTMVPNGSVMPPNTTYMASNPLSQADAGRLMSEGARRVTTSRDGLPYENATATSPSYVVALLFLVSLVGNVYLVMLLNQLLHRYRTLQASNRGITSLAV